MKVPMPYWYISLGFCVATQCSKKVNGMSCLINGLGIISKQSSYTVRASSMLLLESCVSGRKPQLRIVCMYYVCYLYDSASYVVGTDVLSRGVMRPRRKVYRTPPSNAEAKNEWNYTSPSICFHGVDRAIFIDAFDIYPLTPQVHLMSVCMYTV